MTKTTAEPRFETEGGEKLLEDHQSGKGRQRLGLELETW
jgi:hypothetical protein